MNPEDLIKAPIKVAKDLVDLSKPVKTRLINRYKELKKLSQAKNEKIMRGRLVDWHTTPPTMNICKLEMYMSAGDGKISYEEYRGITEKNKCIHNEWKEGMPNREKGLEVKNVVVGNKWLNERSEPIVEAFVVETIKAMKPIKVVREEVDNE